MTSDDMVYNWLVVEMFAEMANLLEIKGASSYRAAAYRRAARSLERSRQDVRELMEAEQLQSIEGIGEALADKIREIVQTGTCEQLERLRGEVPVTLLDFLELPGVGPKSVSAFYNRLGITGLEELERAAEEGQIRQLRGFGQRSEQNILEAIEKLREREKYWLLAVALPVGRQLAAKLGELPGVLRAELAGSTRRKKEKVQNIDIVLAVREDQLDEVAEAAKSIEPVQSAAAAAERTLDLVVTAGIQVRLRLSPPEEFPTTLQQLTGSEKHNTQLHNWAAEQGLKLNERGLYDSDEGRREIQSETQLYTELGLAFIEPELRQGAGELEVAAQASLPSLVTLDDIRGDLHMHTRWSDGAGTLEEMMRAGRELDYEYIAISDHSESLVIANGLTADELRRQVERIAEYNEQHEGLHVLTSIEVDILGDGSLDFPDSLLAELDIVTASVHSSFEQDREVMTRRLLRAMENPQVDVIGHLTGRLLNRRDAYELELDQLIQKAAETGTALELNASPDRLDIDGGTARKAREAGVPVVVNTDAHAVGTLEDMVWGVNQARRGWLEPSDIINCLELSALLDFLGAPKADRSL